MKTTDRKLEKKSGLREKKRQIQREIEMLTYGRRKDKNSVEKINGSNLVSHSC